MSDPAPIDYDALRERFPWVGPGNFEGGDFGAEPEQPPVTSPSGGGGR